MSFDFKKYHDQLLFVPLGGSNEIGMNLNLYHYKGKWLMIDLGIGFADEYLPGVEVILPNIEFIAERKKDLLGLVLTHAHEDHLGAVPYLWEELGCPVYATAFTSAMLKYKLQEEGLANKVPIHEVKPGAHIGLGPFSLEMVGLTHSIPEMQAIAIRTDVGTVMHTGDWKFDETPLVGPVSDFKTLTRYGDEGVLAMVCDSTNVFVEGESGSEEGVRQSLVKFIGECKNRVVVTTFASNIARLETILLAAKEAGRVVALAGRSLKRVVAAGQESGYLKEEIEIVDEQDAMNIPKKDALIICTGCQGEPLAALTKIARGEHPNIRLAPGDTVIFASRIIPGNEGRIAWVHNQLVEKGIEVITDREQHVHVSGHPARDELARMYQLVRPKIAVPVHGEPRHIHEHAKLARSLQVPHAVEATNGAVILLSDKEKPEIIGRVTSGYLAVDGSSIIPTDSAIIKQRRRLREEGCVIVSVIFNKHQQLAAPPQIAAPGAMDEKTDKDLIAACREEVTEALEDLKRGSSEEKIRESVRAAIRRVFKQELDKKPMIEVLIARI